MAGQPAVFLCRLELFSGSRQPLSKLRQLGEGTSIVCAVSGDPCPSPLGTLPTNVPEFSLAAKPVRARGAEREIPRSLALCGHVLDRLARRENRHGAAPA